MRAAFEPALVAVLQHEGGYVNDPQDPGGATNRGVTQTVYDDYRRGKGLAPRSVRQIEQSEIGDIYRKLYWDKVRGDDLPSGVDYAVFDFAVNSGPARAARFLQRAVGVTEDGKIGPITIAAAKAKEPTRVITALCCARQQFLEGLPHFARFGRGWTRRVSEVQAQAVRMA